MLAYYSSGKSILSSYLISLGVDDDQADQDDFLFIRAE